jgi:hypothetical protein
MALNDTRGVAGRSGRLTPERRRAVEQRRGVAPSAATTTTPQASAPSSAPSYSPGQFARANPVNPDGVNPALFSRTPEHQASYDRVLSGGAADRMRDYETQAAQNYQAAVVAGVQNRTGGVEQFLSDLRSRPTTMAQYEAPAQAAQPTLPQTPPYVRIGNEYSREYLTGPQPQLLQPPQQTAALPQLPPHITTQQPWNGPMMPPRGQESPYGPGGPWLREQGYDGWGNPINQNTQRRIRGQ